MRNAVRFSPFVRLVRAARTFDAFGKTGHCLGRVGCLVIFPSFAERLCLANKAVSSGIAPRARSVLMLGADNVHARIALQGVGDAATFAIKVFFGA